MENTTNESESRRAWKVATYASAITLVGVAAIKTKHAVGNRLQNRRDRRNAPLTKDA